MPRAAALNIRTTIAVCFCVALDACSSPIMAQSSPSPLAPAGNPSLAQAPPPPDNTRINPSVLPTDATPLIFTGERGYLSREMKMDLLKRLPARLWFNTSTEISQRFESNPRFTATDEKGDYVFRTLPNITLGYDVYKKTSIYANYFLIKDVFARFGGFDQPTTQSLGMGVRRPFNISKKLSAQLDFQARELWQASHLHQFDFLPSAGLTYVVTPRVVLFASSVLQMRGREYFVAPTREIDPFYSAGILLRKGKWNLVLTDTFVTNFRRPPFENPIPQHGNVSMIADAELNHPISNRYLPGVVAFIRAEPVWNWRSNNLPGLSGFDFRFFSGIRIAVNKPDYYGNMERARKQIIEYNKQMKSKKRSGQGAPGKGLAPSSGSQAPAQEQPVDSDSKLRPALPQNQAPGPNGSLPDQSTIGDSAPALGKSNLPAATSEGKAASASSMVEAGAL